MKKVSVDLDSPSPYIETGSYFYNIKRKLTYAFAINAIARVKRKEEEFSLLEIGTGSGYFLSFAHSAFPRASLSGIEYDPRLLEVTKRKVPFANCLKGNAELFDFGSEKFDVIVSFQVIEHLYEPGAMLERVRNHLKPNGIFIMTTPNLDGLGARLMGKRWHGYREDHVSLKGYTQWKSLLEECGFVPVYCGSTFFSGIPILNRLPLGIFNWMLLTIFGAARWKHGESFVGVFKVSD